MSSQEPESWGEFLKQYERGRNHPPPLESYKRDEIVVHEEGGIFSDTRKLETGSVPIHVDTHIYSTTAIFDPLEEKPRRKIVARDHGLDFLAWPKKPKEEQIPARFSKRDGQVRDYNAITGVPFESNFKSTVKHIIDTREVAKSVSLRRSIDPVSNTFPTAELEATREEQEALQRQAMIACRLERMPENEKRTQTGAYDIICGTTVDEKLASKLVNDYPNSNPGRAKLALDRESKLLAQRESERLRDMARVSCRFNNGRASELRNYNIINGASVHQSLDKSVKNKPSVWMWCNTEKLDVI